MRFKFLVSLLLMFFTGVSSYAQVRITTAVEVIDDRHLGYSLPVGRFSVSFEQAIGPHFELDGGAGYAVAHKAVLGNGSSVLVNLKPIVWLLPNFGITGDVRYTHLYTSAYSKGTFLPSLGVANTILPSLGSLLFSPGVVFRGRLAGLPTRLFVDGIVPTGTINPSTGIESNRLRGVETRLEVGIANAGPTSLRFLVSPSAYRGYSQGNPQCDGTYGGVVTCPRASWNAFTFGLGVKFAWPRE